jgi:DNA-binding MarR family transcriptional regulator
VSSEDKSAPEPLAKLLWRAHHWFRMAVKERLEDSTGAVSPAESTLLSQLDPDGMPMADLARLMGVSTPAVHQMVHRLVTAGLLEVAPNPRSGRSKLVLLTPEGLTRRREAMELLSDLEDELAHRIGRRRVTGLRDALQQDWGDTADRGELPINAADRGIGLALGALLPPPAALGRNHPCAVNPSPVAALDSPLTGINSPFAAIGPGAPCR